MKNRPHARVQNAQRKLRIDMRGLQEFAQRALEHCLDLPSLPTGPLHGLPEVNVILVSDRRIAALHKKFMNIGDATDVLTFQHGEIFVSVETARENARRFDASPDAEIRLYIVHGLLHLLGFDDKNAEDARLMTEVQRRVLLATCPSPNDR